MKRTHIFVVLGAVLLLIISVVVRFFVVTHRDELTQPKVAATPQAAVFQIEGRSVSIGDTLRYFGNELAVDLSGDGRADSVFFVTDSPGGSGTFYYVVAAIQTDEGYVGSNGIFVGDRISPQTINLGIHADPASADAARAIIAASYADRKPGESFAVKPSVGQTLWLRFDPTTSELVNVEPTFEAEPVGRVR